MQGNVMVAEFNYCFFFNAYIETSLLQSPFIFLTIKIVYLLLQVVLSLNKLLMF